MSDVNESSDVYYDDEELEKSLPEQSSKKEDKETLKLQVQAKEIELNNRKLDFEFKKLEANQKLEREKLEAEKQKSEKLLEIEKLKNDNMLAVEREKLEVEKQKAENEKKAAKKEFWLNFTKVAVTVALTVGTTYASQKMFYNAMNFEQSGSVTSSCGKIALGLIKTKNNVTVT